MGAAVALRWRRQVQQEAAAAQLISQWAQVTLEPLV
ncbi:hypothetical protein PC116_g33053, partial [Phytophthora cactorum]